MNGNPFLVPRQGKSKGQVEEGEEISVLTPPPPCIPLLRAHLGVLPPPQPGPGCPSMLRVRLFILFSPSSQPEPISGLSTGVAHQSLQPSQRFGCSTSSLHPLPTEELLGIAGPYPLPFHCLSPRTSPWRPLKLPFPSLSSLLSGQQRPWS